MARLAESQAIRAASVWIVEHAGTKTLKMYHTASIKKFPRGISDQVISSRNAATVAGRRAPDPGLFLSNELRAASVKLRAERRAASYELRAWSVEQQAINVGPIIERQAWRFAMIA